MARRLGFYMVELMDELRKKSEQTHYALAEFRLRQALPCDRTILTNLFSPDVYTSA